ncbi:MAG TPA: hypothetical protein VF131_01055 [Blastocatellia bacterium]|nr:hypothetical protein [Blastocatellia bacterium]
MRSESKNISLSLTALLALTCFCCGKNNDEISGLDQSPHIPGSSRADQFTDSGKRLSGEFVFQVVKDLYAPEGSLGSETRVFTFDEDGNFKVEKFAGSTATIEEGGYLIDRQGELILYFDKAGGALLESARRERYNIISQTDLALRLEQPPTKEFVLRKR